MNRFTFFITCVAAMLLLTNGVRAQQADSLLADSLSLQEAVSLALEQNHNISIAENQAQIDENNATLGNAGYFPTVTASGSYSRSIENTRLNFAGSTPDTSRSGSESSRLNGQIAAQYTLFDGFGNTYRLRNLESQADLGSTQSRLQIENTLLQVIQAYLQTIAQSRLVNINKELVSISAERYKRAQRQYKMGGRTKVNLLNAEVALNQDSVRFVESRANLNDAKRNLLVLLGSEPSNNITVAQHIDINRKLELQNLLQESLQNNASLISSELQSDLARLSLKQSKSRRYPQINAEASYGYTRSESDANILIFQETDGFTAGISLNFTIFNGFQREIDIQNARIRLKNSRERRRLAEKNVRRNVRNMYETYTKNRFLLDKQNLNVRTAELNFERTRQAFELGQVTNTEFREAQLNLMRARQELINLKVNAKLAEIELLQLSGQLLENKVQN